MINSMSAVQVYLAKDEMEANLIKGLLSSVEIESVMNPINTNEPPYRYINAATIPYGIFVKEDEAEEAKKVLAERK